MKIFQVFRDAGEAAAETLQPGERVFVVTNGSERYYTIDKTAGGALLSVAKYLGFTVAPDGPKAPESLFDRVAKLSDEQRAELCKFLGVGVPSNG